MCVRFSYEILRRYVLQSHGYGKSVEYISAFVIVRFVRYGKLVVSYGGALADYISIYEILCFVRLRRADASYLRSYVLEMPSRYKCFLLGSPRFVNRYTCKLDDCGGPQVATSKSRSWNLIPKHFEIRDLSIATNASWLKVAASR